MVAQSCGAACACGGWPCGLRVSVPCRAVQRRACKVHDWERSSNTHAAPLHCTWPSAEKNPGRHFVHETVAALGAKWPFAQTWQVRKSGSSAVGLLYLPSAHSVQLTAPFEEYLPGSQTLHSTGHG